MKGGASEKVPDAPEPSSSDIWVEDSLSSIGSSVCSKLLTELSANKQAKTPSEKTHKLLKRIGSHLQRGLDYDVKLNNFLLAL